MADIVSIKDANNNPVPVLTDEVTDGTIGTGQVQFAKIMDGTLDSTNKLVINSSGEAKVVGPLTNTELRASAVAVQATSLNDGGNSITVDDGGSSLTVDGTVAATQSGSWSVTANAGTNLNTSALALESGGNLALQTTALQLIDDPVATLGTTTYTEATTKGFIIGALRRDADTSAVNTTNEIAPLLVDANGYLKVEIFDGGGSHTVDNNGTFAVQAAQSGSWSVTAAGDVASDAVDSGNPIKIGGQARTTNPTAVANSDRVNAIFDKVGRLVVVQGHARELVGSGTLTITSSTTETTFIGATALTFHDITQLTITNASATPTSVELRDTTGGTVIRKWNISGGGGVVESFNPPLTQTTVNTNWTLKTLASVDSVYANAVYVNNI